MPCRTLVAAHAAKALLAALLLSGHTSAAGAASPDSEAHGEHMGIALNHYQTGKVPLAMEHFRTAMKADPTKSEA
jgi:hypothetical protein